MSSHRTKSYVLKTIQTLGIDGFGRVADQLVVPYTIPGEEVTVYVSHSAASLCSINVASPSRVEPRCKHFGSCGGCRLQHMDPVAQAVFKESIIHDLFSDYSACIEPIIAAPLQYGYRNKMVWSFSESSRGEKFLGLILQSSHHKVGTVTECHLVPSWMVGALKSVREWWQENKLQAYSYTKNSGHLRTLTMRESPHTGDRVIILTVSGNPDYPLKQHDVAGFLTVCKAYTGEGCLTVVLQIHQSIKDKPLQVYEMRLFGPDVFKERFTVANKELEFHVSPSSFLQPNSHMASRIYSKAVECAAFSKEDILYDLYSGVGVFGMSVAHLVSQVVLIESHPDAAYDARCNKERLMCDNVVAFEGDVRSILEAKKWTAPTVIFLNPPRKGVGKEVVDEIIRLNPERIIYLSSNPVSQFEDVAALTANYEVVTICPIDQFPQTHHVENIVSLKRKK